MGFDSSLSSGVGTGLGQRSLDLRVFSGFRASDVEEIGARHVFPETLNPGRRVRRLAGLQLP